VSGGGASYVAGQQADERLQDILSRAFAIQNGYRELNGYLVGIVDLYDRIGDGSEAMRLSIRKLLDEVAADRDLVDKFLIALLKGICGCFEYRDWIRSNRAELLAQVTEDAYQQARPAYEADRLERRIFVVKAGIEQAGRLALTPEQAALFRQMAETLEDLRGYKNMHELLHEIQTQSLLEINRLLGDGTAIADDARAALADQALELTAQRGRFDLFCQQYDRLRDPRFAPIGTELTAVTALLGGRDLEPVRGRYKLRSLLRQFMPILDAELVRTAEAIPFTTVAGMLRVLADAAPDTVVKAGLSQTIDALVGIDARLLRRRSAHQTWQQVDAKLWQAEDVLQGAGLAQELIFLWQDIVAMTQALDDRDESISLLSVKAGPIQAEASRSFPTPWVTLRTLFGGYARTARNVFRQSDLALLSDCEALNKELSSPLRQAEGH
jgi:hypothetical protein